MITCQELFDFLMDYLDGNLSHRDRREFERHLSACPDCVNYMAMYADTVKLGKSAFTDSQSPTSSTVPEELVQAVLRARREKL